MQSVATEMIAAFSASLALRAADSREVLFGL
jgi:hypothetical protein